MFKDFEKKYGPDPNGQSKRNDTGEEGRFRKFSISEIKGRNYNLDISWLKDESLEDPDSLPEPQELAADAITELETCINELQEILELIDAEVKE
jgi:type I restriction enzyme M protein